MRAAKSFIVPLLFVAVLLSGCAPTSTEVDDDPDEVAPTTEVVESPTPAPAPEAINLSAISEGTDANGYSYRFDFTLTLGEPVLDSSQDKPGETSVVYRIEDQSGEFANTTSGAHDVELLNQTFGYQLRPVFPRTSSICGVPTARILPSGDCVFDRGGAVVWDESATVPSGSSSVATTGDFAEVRADAIPEGTAEGMLAEFAHPIGLVVLAPEGDEGATSRPGDVGGYTVVTTCSFRVGDVVGQGEFVVVAQSAGMNVCAP
jgi:hypothetical protein